MRLGRTGLVLFGTLLAAAPLAAGFPPPPPLPPLPHVSVRVVPAPPPPPRHVVIVQRPGPDYVWEDGYWDYAPSGWVWVDGRWDRAPYRHARWVRPRYLRRHGGWHYVPGHWS